MTLTTVQNLMAIPAAMADLASSRADAAEKTHANPHDHRVNDVRGLSDRPLAAATRPATEVSADGVSVRDIYALMALFSKTAQQARTACRNMRQEELDAFQNAAGLAADAMREAGRQRFVGSLVAGGGQCLGGVLQLSGGLYGASAMNKSSIMQQRANTRAADAAAFTAAAKGRANPADVKSLESYASAINAEASQLGTTSQAIMHRMYNFNTVLSGMPNISSGITAAGKGVFDLAATEEDAKRLIFETQSRVCENRMQAEERVMQDRYAEMQDLREKLNAIAQARLDTNRTVARNI